MDIHEGDYLVVAGKDYPIKECAEWQDPRMNTVAIRRMANVSCSTKRPPAMVTGLQAAATAKLLGLKCTPLDPVDSEIRKRLAVDAPVELLQTFITDGSGFVHLVLEDLKK